MRWRGWVCRWDSVKGKLPPAPPRKRPERILRALLRRKVVPPHRAARRKRALRKNLRANLPARLQRDLREGPAGSPVKKLRQTTASAKFRRRSRRTVPIKARPAENGT